MRPSFSGASTRMRWSFISIAALLCDPPAMNQTPSATFSAVTRSAAARTLSGTWMSAAALGWTSFTVRSSVGWPPWDCWIRPGNFTPP